MRLRPEQQTQTQTHSTQTLASVRLRLRSLSEHAAQIILANWNKDWDMPREMTALPKKLKQGGYATHMVGKVRTAARLLPAPD